MRLLLALALAAGLCLAPPAFAQRHARGGGAAPDSPKRQAELLHQQIAALPAQRAGVTDVYVLGIAAFATQSVFRSELEGALAATARALPVAGTVRLVNSPETIASIPLASRQNFRAAVQGIAGVMDKDEDVLFLFMTSHGTPRGIVLQLPGVFARLSPREVARTLDKQGVRHRVVIVSACYAGIFVRPLANENSIVLTAADAKNTSFGCADDREWTYFGDALFRHSLKPGIDLRIAFSHARGLIAGWEKLDRFTPSNPQGHFGDALAQKLAPLIEAARRP
jgi:hypothetical protein